MTFIRYFRVFVIPYAFLAGGCVAMQTEPAKTVSTTGLIATPASYYSTPKARYLGARYKDNLERLIERIVRNPKSSTLQFANNISSVGGVGFFTHSATKTPDERYLEVVLGTPETFETRGSRSEKVAHILSLYGVELLAILSEDNTIYQDQELSGYGLNLAWRNVVPEGRGSRVVMERAILYFSKEKVRAFLRREFDQNELLREAVIFAVEEDGPLQLVSYSPQERRAEVRPAIREDVLTPGTMPAPGSPEPSPKSDSESTKPMIARSDDRSAKAPAPQAETGMPDKEPSAAPKAAAIEPDAVARPALPKAEFTPPPARSVEAKAREESIGRPPAEAGPGQSAVVSSPREDHGESSARASERVPEPAAPPGREDLPATAMERAEPVTAPDPGPMESVSGESESPASPEAVALADMPPAPMETVVSKPALDPPSAPAQVAEEPAYEQVPVASRAKAAVAPMPAPPAPLPPSPEAIEKTAPPRSLPSPPAAVVSPPADAPVSAKPPVPGVASPPVSPAKTVETKAIAVDTVPPALLRPAPLAPAHPPAPTTEPTPARTAPSTAVASVPLASKEPEAPPASQKLQATAPQQEKEVSPQVQIERISPAPEPPVRIPAPPRETGVERNTAEQIALLRKPPVAALPEAKPRVPTPPRALEGFIVQLAFDDKVKAKRWAETMEQRGYAVSITEAGSGLLRVRLGNFAQRDEAERQLRTLKQEGLSGIVINMPQSFRPEARSSVP